MLHAAVLVATFMAASGGSAQTTTSSTTTQDAARGVLRASQEAVLASSISARVLTMPYREGDRFTKGATLVSFDCGRQRSELAAARAGQAAETRNVDVQRELLQHQATGKAELDIAIERERERGAQAQALVQHMRGCDVAAPFAGRVVETYARMHETPSANEKLLRIVSDGPLELHVVVPSRWLTWLKLGARIDVKVDETGDVVPAEVQRVSAAVDPVSQTVKIVASISKRPALVLPGMSGSVAMGAHNPEDTRDASDRATSARMASASSRPDPVARGDRR
jgi:membrane fusion protein, multidrug efflux system